MKKELTPGELQAVRLVRESVGDATQGLPEEIFELSSSIVPLINVDLFVQDEQGKILMIWREDSICGSGWHIPGGIIRFKESIEERIQKTAQGELGVQVRFDPKPVAINEFILPQEVRGHFISLLYRCYLPKIFSEHPTANWEKHYRPGDICWHGVCPQQWVKAQKDAYGTLFELPRQTERMLAVEKMRSGECTIVFDIDGVIAEFDPTLRYDQAEPVNAVIKSINRLYGLGNRIVLFTARGSETGHDWSETTKIQMKNWGVNYHELRFGKPAATFYVDDKNLSLDELDQLINNLE